jgi:molecular chaperone DnaK
MLVNELRQKLKQEAPADEVKNLMNELRGALVLLQQASAAAREPVGAGAGAGGSGSGEASSSGASAGGASGDDVVDAEFRASDE